LFRPPSGLAWPSQLREARDLGYVAVLGSAYPHDPAHPPVRYIEWLVKKNLVPGAIVILHDGISDPSRSIQALPGILAEGERRGLHCPTLGGLKPSPLGESFSSGRGRMRPAWGTGTEHTPYSRFICTSCGRRSTARQ
jgi:hypothetical protein